MSIDYEICSCCGEAFPDVMEYGYCARCGAIFCEGCMNVYGLEDEEVTEESCPFCSGKEIDSDEFLNWLFDNNNFDYDRIEYEEEFRNYKKGKLHED